jgi:hypothetical protein
MSPRSPVTGLHLSSLYARKRRQRTCPLSCGIPVQKLSGNVRKNRCSVGGETARLDSGGCRRRKRSGPLHRPRRTTSHTMANELLQIGGSRPRKSTR